MVTQGPLIRFYELSGPKPTCEKLFGDMKDLEATFPIVEDLRPDYKARNSSTPTAEFLDERFTEKDGYRYLRDVDKSEAQ